MEFASLTRYIKQTAYLLLAFFSVPLVAEPIPVLQKEGSLHGFLLLMDENGKEIAAGDQVAEVRGNIVHVRRTFQFRDGSVDDETVIYKQSSNFQLMYDHHIQKGPAFAKPSDVTIDVRKGEVTWVESTSKGAENKAQHLDMPPDLANGIVSLTVENFPSGATEMKVSYVAVESKPRIIHLTVKPDGKDRVLLGTSDRQADRYNVHIDLGGVAGAVAPMMGKQPPDFKLWAVDGGVRTFVKMAGPLYENGPAWTMTLAAPSWPDETPQK